MLDIKFEKNADLVQKSANDKGYKVDIGGVVAIRR